MKKANTKHRPEKQTSLIVDKENELLKFLIAQLPQQGRNSIKSLLSHRQISVDGEVTTLFNYPLVAGQKVNINRSKVYQERRELKPLGLKIFFEDEYLIIIEKPAGMLSIATDREKELTAYNVLSTHIKKRDSQSRVFVVHRLDKETSGVMMFAKSEEIKEKLQNAWKEVVLERSYAVVVHGPLTDDQGTITSWLTENKALRMYSSKTPNGGQKAVTHYKVLEKNNSYSLLEVKLETGRKNQIRIHMQDIGHSVIGDIKYGGVKSSINRLGLHAHILAFKHPVTNEIMHFESPIPKEFLSLFHKKQNK
ncbi:MAG: RluA family pseudouridine synthase [Dehalobacter sp. 4CP]|uniref:RluA family pseudouridine synthase n=1 Tax=Dehalobacter sp. CP TaxID=2594474 RepID=UPI0013C6F7CB|nr:RluA family pseudouridine synthase [Dehalobacter sp.]NBJ15906.1 RluA family pseudouridine synthase [Dehalobacter sp. 4CP]